MRSPSAVTPREEQTKECTLSTQQPPLSSRLRRYVQSEDRENRENVLIRVDKGAEVLTQSRPPSKDVQCSPIHKHPLRESVDRSAYYREELDRVKDALE